MSSSQTLNFNKDMAQVALPKSVLAQLIASGILHGDQCKCLNTVAKNVLWQSLLNNSLKMEF